MRAQQKPATNPEAMAASSTAQPAHHQCAGTNLSWLSTAILSGQGASWPTRRIGNYSLKPSSRLQNATRIRQTGVPGRRSVVTIVTSATRPAFAVGGSDTTRTLHRHSSPALFTGPLHRPSSPTAPSLRVRPGHPGAPGFPSRAWERATVQPPLNHPIHFTIWSQTAQPANTVTSTKATQTNTSDKGDGAIRRSVCV